MADDVERALAELRREYARELPAKVSAIVEALARNDRATATLLAHRLRGTAGSYGFAEVSAAAATIEAALEASDPPEAVERACAALRILTPTDD